MRKWPDGDQIAVIRERTEITGGGAVALVLLILHNIGVALWFAGAGNAIQQAVIGTIWIGGNVLWGLGAALGRRRTYAVYRMPPEQDGRDFT